MSLETKLGIGDFPFEINLLKYTGCLRYIKNIKARSIIASPKSSQNTLNLTNHSLRNREQ